MIPTPQHSKVRLQLAFETVTGLYLGEAPGRPNGGSRRERADKYVVRTAERVIVHVPKDDVLELEVLP